ncbi:MAG: divalent-cation tolerance protein CutA [Bdellovibrionota bacterium]
MSDLRILYSTFPNEKAAQIVADKVVDLRLAACVNLFPLLSSTYLWKGKRQRDKEVVFFAKTHKKNISKLKKKVESLHPYECPCLIVFKSSQVNKAYLQWIK